MPRFFSSEQCYTVSFFGHRKIDFTYIVEDRLEGLIRSLLLEKEYVEFLVGRDGDFDIWTASVNTPGWNRQFDRARPTPLPLKSYTLSASPTPSV